MRCHASLFLVAALACAPAKGETQKAASPLAGTGVRIECLYTAENGDRWFGTDGDGVYRHDGERLVRYTRADGLPGMQVRSVLDDERGGVLVSTTDGVGRFDGERFVTLEIEELSGSDGWRLDPDDVWLVVAPGEGGPCRFDGETLYRLELTKSPAEEAFRRAYPRAAFEPDGVYCVYEDRRGHVWFGTAAAGLCRYDGETLAWMYEERLTTTPAGGAFGIRSIYEDTAGDFWICNTRQRFEFAPEVSAQDGFPLLQYETEEGLPASQADTDANFFYFASITEDDEGSLWMTSGEDGLYEYDGESVTRYSIGDGAYATGVHRDRDGSLWVGTLEHGVYTFDGERLAPFE